MKFSLFLVLLLPFYSAKPILGIVDQGQFLFNYIATPMVLATMTFGARIVPLDFNLSESELKQEMNKLNGLIFPGGTMHLCSEKAEYSAWTLKAKIIFDYALQLNDSGSYFPIWGSCQGLEAMSIFVAQDCSVLTPSPLFLKTASINYTEAASHSRLLADFDTSLLMESERQAITLNNHGYGISTQTYKNNEKLNSFFSLLGSSVDSEGTSQIAIMEARNYPIYTTMFHPEQVAHYFQNPPTFIRSIEAIEYGQAFFRFFVQEARKNKHYMSQDEFKERDIERDPLTIVELKIPDYETQIDIYIYQ